jgi:phasin family protein
MTKAASTQSAKPRPASDTPAEGGLNITKILQQLRLPGVDVNSVVEAQRKDIEALVTASQLAREGFQSLADKQTEMLRAAMEHFQTLVKDQTSSAADRSLQAKDALGTALQNMRELAEMSVRSHEQAFSTLSERVQERITQLIQPR